MGLRKNGCHRSHWIQYSFNSGRNHICSRLFSLKSLQILFLYLCVSHTQKVRVVTSSWSHSSGVVGRTRLEAGQWGCRLAAPPRPIRRQGHPPAAATPHQKRHCQKDDSYCPSLEYIQCTFLLQNRKHHMYIACGQREIQFPLIFSPWSQEGSHRRKGVPEQQIQHIGRRRLQREQTCMNKAVLLATPI